MHKFGVSEKSIYLKKATKIFSLNIYTIIISYVYAYYVYTYIIKIIVSRIIVQFKMIVSGVFQRKLSICRNTHVPFRKTDHIEEILKVKKCNICELRIVILKVTKLTDFIEKLFLILIQNYTNLEIVFAIVWGFLHQIVMYCCQKASLLVR